MTSQSSTNGRPLQTTHPIQFLIIGGGIAGLACAFALRRVGHHTLVVERGDRKDESVRGKGGVRLGPNLTKILLQWGLVLKDKVHTSNVITLGMFESGEYLGTQVWNEEILRESRGDFMVTTHEDLYDILYEAAAGAGATVRFNSEVVHIDPKTRNVKLKSGEILSGDVLIGADGEYGLSRVVVVGQQARGTPTGLTIYDTMVSTEYLPSHMRPILDDGMFAAFGDARGIVGYPIGKYFAFQLYRFDDTQSGRYGDVPSVETEGVAKDIEPRLHSMVKNARKAVPIPVLKYKDLEEWVEENGRLLLTGQAAHPFPAGTIQATPMAVEDGAVLAKLFSHLSEERQIENFLFAFQELRRSRVDSVHAEEVDNAFYLAMPACETSRQRDASLRALADVDVRTNILEGSLVNRAFTQVRIVAEYDCEDEADDWWVRWGLLRERALDRQAELNTRDEDAEEDGEYDADEDEDDEAATPETALDLSALTIQVSSSSDKHKFESKNEEM